MEKQLKERRSVEVVHIFALLTIVLAPLVADVYIRTVLDGQDNTYAQAFGSLALVALGYFVGSRNGKEKKHKCDEETK